MKTVVIVPTYNEREGIEEFIRSLFALNGGFDILVVDDSSPDGTGEIVKKLQKEFSQLFIEIRKSKDGLAQAYIHGFLWAMKKGYEVLVQMDSDFSHRPQDLKAMLEKIQDYDFIIGSRYTEDGGTKNWGFIRRMISQGGSLYARSILQIPIRDWTGGFNIWRKRALEKIDLTKIESGGYCFQIEMKYKGAKAGLKHIEFPILFEERRAGQSKMSSKIVLEAFYKVWKIRGL